MILELKLKKIRLKEQKKLNKTNHLLFKDITSYIKNSNLREIEKEEVLQQIMDMLLEAQVEGKPVDLFIGKDYEVFCNDIIREYEIDKPESYGLADYLQSSLLYLLAIIIAMGGYNFIGYGKGNFSTSIYGIVFAFSISFIAIPFSRKTIYPSNPVVFSKNIVIRRGRLRAMNVMSWLSILIPGIIRSSVRRIYDINISDYLINLSDNLLYLAIILVMVIGLTVYKKESSH